MIVFCYISPKFRYRYNGKKKTLMGDCVVNVFIAFSCFWMVRYWVVRKGEKKADNFVLTWILTCLVTHMKLCLLLWTFFVHCPRTCRYVVWTAIERGREKGNCFLWLALAAPNPCKMMSSGRRESTLWLQPYCSILSGSLGFFSQPTHLHEIPNKIS